MLQHVDSQLEAAHRHKLAYLYDADGKKYLLLDDDGARMELGSWGSTLDATYGQLRFDQITGWSRWLKLNQQEPNLECFVEPYTTIWPGKKAGNK